MVQEWMELGGWSLQLVQVWTAAALGTEWMEPAAGARMDCYGAVIIAVHASIVITTMILCNFGGS